MTPYIAVDKEKCVGCELCNDVCTSHLFSFEDGLANATHTTCMKCNLCVAVCPTEALSCDLEEAPIPYDKEAMSVDEDKLLNLMKYRRSMRKYTDEKLPEEVIKKVMVAGQYAPKGGNRDLFRYIVIQDQIEEYRVKFLKQLKEVALGLPSDSPLISAKSAEVREQKRQRMCALYDRYVSEGFDGLTFKAPCMVIMLADKNAGGRPLWDSGIASAYMELEATAMGLGLCYLGYAMTALENSKELQEFVGMKENEMPASIFVIGYPGYDYQRTAPRKDLDIEFK